MPHQEKLIETAIIQFIRYIGGWAQKVHSGAMQKAYTYRRGDSRGATRTHWMKLADKGTPDILACIKGKFVAIEVKKDEKEIEKWREEKDSHSEIQHRQQEGIREAGGITLVVCSVEQIENNLKELKLIS